MQSNPSNSSVQLQAEVEMLQEIGKKIDCVLTKEPIQVDNHMPLEVDGVSKSEYILCEAYAHIGKLKGAQHQKVITDAMKMLYAERLLGGKWRKILLFADDTTAKSFESGTWYAEAIKEFEIEIRIVTLKDETRYKILEAQKRQVMQNIGGNA